MGDFGNPDFIASSGQGFIAFANLHNAAFRFAASFALESLQKLFHIGKYWNSANFTVLCSCFRITPDNDFISIPFHVVPLDPNGFRPYAHSTVREEFNQIAHARTPSPTFYSQILNQRPKL